MYLQATHAHMRARRQEFQILTFIDLVCDQRARYHCAETAHGKSAIDG
jgi:hypothetical protein